mmetsp:Transcript_20951/g.54489  ORF Transcript_20951/g.54489 Transcript_20951/m.54489 type:complete len:515 (+) Transcript_20951:160-1704(+)
MGSRPPTANIGDVKRARHSRTSRLGELVLLASTALVATACGGAVNVAPAACSFNADPQTVERFGGDYSEIHLAGSNATLGGCAELCCSERRCLAFSFNHPSSSDERVCRESGPCCKLKSRVPPRINNTYGPSVTTGVVARPPLPPKPPVVFPVPPGQPSVFLKGCEIDASAAVTPGVQGDTWPSTWTAGGDSFAMGCDNQPPGQPKSFMNWWHTSPDPLTVKLVNNAPLPIPVMLDICAKYTTNVTSNGNIKPSSVIAINNTLYAGVQCITYSDSANRSFVGRQRAWNAWIITSTNGGVTWDVAATAPEMFTGKLTNPVFIQAGPGHRDAPDSYVYVHFPAAAVPATAYWDGNEFILLGRVPTSRILERSAYQFWTGAGWVADAAAAIAIFDYPFMVGQDHSFYSVPLKRYFLPNYGFVDRDSGQPVGWHGYYTRTHRAPTSQFTLYEAPTPHGPWSLVHVQQPWNLGGNGAYCPDFPARWASADGLTLQMVASACCGQPGYQFTMMQVRCTLA